MRYKNEQDGCDILRRHALKATAFTRTKHDVLAVRHLYADSQQYQVIWRVEDIDLAQAEALLQAIAREFDGDRAATDAPRILRVPGFMNKTYDQDFLVSAQRKRVRVENLSRSFGVAYKSVALLFPFLIVPNLVPAPGMSGKAVLVAWTSRERSSLLCLPH